MAQPLPWKYHFLLYTFFMICSPPIHPRIKLTLDSATFLFLSFELLTFFFYNRSNAPFRLKNLYMECSVLIVQPGATCILHYPSYLNKNPIDIFFFTFFFLVQHDFMIHQEMYMLCVYVFPPSGWYMFLQPVKGNLLN